MGKTQLWKVHGAKLNPVCKGPLLHCSDSDRFDGTIVKHRNLMEADTATQNATPLNILKPLAFLGLEQRVDGSMHSFRDAEIPLSDLDRLMSLVGMTAYVLWRTRVTSDVPAPEALAAQQNEQLVGRAQDQR